MSVNYMSALPGTWVGQILSNLAKLLTMTVCSSRTKRLYIIKTISSKLISINEIRMYDGTATSISKVYPESEIYLSLQQNSTNNLILITLWISAYPIASNKASTVCLYLLARNFRKLIWTKTYSNFIYSWLPQRHTVHLSTSKWQTN